MKLLSGDLMLKTAYKQNATKSPNISYSEIQILATSLLNKIQAGEIGFPTQNPQHYNMPFPPIASRQICLAILEMTGFPISASAQRKGRPLPEISDAHKDYAKIILSAATTAHLAAYKNNHLRNPFHSPKYHEWVKLASALLAKEAEISVRLDEAFANSEKQKSTKNTATPAFDSSDEPETIPSTASPNDIVRDSVSGLSNRLSALKAKWDGIDTKPLKLGAIAFVRALKGTPIEKGAFFSTPRTPQ